MILALICAPFLTGSLFGQALTPDPDPPMTNSCGQRSSLGKNDYLGQSNAIEYETFMTSAIDLSAASRTATLPLHTGKDQTGKTVYYILTDVSDCDEARSRGLNYAPKLGFLINADGTSVNKSVMQVNAPDKSGNGIVFKATSDFSPVRIFTPGTPDGWPPAASSPGSIAVGDYTPYITYTVGKKHFVANASQVANATGVKDFIPQIDYVNKTVTFNLVMGIYNFDFVMYLRMDASDPAVTGFEGGIYATAPGLAPGAGQRTFAPGNSRQTILPIVNGIRGVDQIYNRQGLQSAALGEGDPFNVTGATVGEDEYSPIWDITPVVWTQAAINAGKRQRLHQDDEVRAFIQAGYLVGAVASGTPYNSDIGVFSLGAVSNCPIMLRVLKGIPAYPLPATGHGKGDN